MKVPLAPGSFVTRTEIRELLGYSKQGTDNVTRRDDFPAPLDVLWEGKMPIWDREQVEEYVKAFLRRDRNA